MPEKKIVIAIDGPSAAGKSTIGKLLAKALDYTYIDSGAMYRAIALKLHRNNISLDDVAAVEAALAGSSISFRRRGDELRTILDGEDVSEQIRTPVISQLASASSALPVVRRALVRMQQEMGKKGGVVMDGRDIGTVVFPHAERKFFLDASLQERAQRRFRELQAKGMPVTLEQVSAEMKQRDRNDSTRKHSPLRKAEDAILIDSTDLSIAQVVRKIRREVDNYLAGSS